jgi:hypothetical protein
MKKTRATLQAITLAAIAACTSRAAAANIGCPATIQTEQKASAPQPWTVGYGALPIVLTQVTIFEGPPSEQASLEYDNEKKLPKEIVLTWTLGPSKRGYWLQCAYSSTTAIISRRLPDTVKRCDVRLARDNNVNGQEIVNEAACGPASESAIAK